MHSSQIMEPDAVGLGRQDPWPEAAVIGAPHSVPQGAVLFRQGASAQTLYLVTTGCVKLTCSDDGGRDRLMALRLPGWLVGVAAATLGRPHPVTAEALGPCEVRPIPVAGFLRLRQTDVAVLQWVQRMQSLEAYEQVGLLGLLGPAKSELRLERLLIKLAQSEHQRRRDGSLKLMIHMRHEDMAQAIGTTRETIGRLLDHLEQRGELRREGGWLVLPKGTRLARQLTSNP
jgi:CRP/FNR family cyclic AMP-dependent transcriptional regulator